MGTTAQKLNKILETKEAIRTAINNKGGTLTTTDTFASYPSAINNIQSGGGKSTIYKTLEAMGTNWHSAFYTDSSYNIFANMTELIESDLPPSNNVVDMTDMFNFCPKLITIPLFDTSSCTSMQSMFSGCSNLTTIPQFDTSKVMNMSYMFSNCSNLTTIPQLNTSSCTNMTRMFQSCRKLTTIPQLNTNNCVSMDYMFYYCIVLEKIDITKLASGENYNNYFAHSCYSLTKLIIRNMTTIPALSSSAFNNCYHFTGTTDATYNPQGLKDGRIYIPDDKVGELKTATNWSVYADIIVPLSTLVE